MKKGLIIAVLAVFGLTNVNAQDISFGVKAGVNFANLGGDVENGDMITGLHVGVLAEFMLTEKFGIQPELLYSLQGSTSERSAESMGVSLNYDYTLKLDYINIPIMAKYYITDGFSVMAGPQIGFLVSANREYEISGDGQNESGEEDIKDYVSSVDYGLGIGAGYQLGSGLFFNARYNLGLANINDADDSEEIHNNVIQVSVGYMF